jgi:hypothetical protein
VLYGCLKVLCCKGLVAQLLLLACLHLHTQHPTTHPCQLDEYASSESFAVMQLLLCSHGLCWAMSKQSCILQQPEARCQAGMVHAAPPSQVLPAAVVVLPTGHPPRAGSTASSITGAAVLFHSHLIEEVSV